MRGSQTNPECYQGLERSCEDPASNRIVSAPAVPGMERIEARFEGKFFEPHRHDTYAIGVTLDGIQSFHYRGRQEYSLPGRLIVLHPDEVHDGAAATEDGLRYRMLYIEPALVREGLCPNTGPLPFVDTPVIDDPHFRIALLSALSRLDDGLDELDIPDLVSRIAGGLSRHARIERTRSEPVSPHRLIRARDYLQDNSARTVHSGELEQVTGLDRFNLSRQFRKFFGTSPHRYLIMRRLDQARHLIACGRPLADIAAAVGFADQSHLTRHFKKSFGVTPGRWANASRHSEIASPA
ncbi:MAG: AraC family transcriptional regulator [Alphaproteobacteria bacterium]|nr:AraC family transcriptional regulator [Alphaproteobacteria bacterium]